MHLIIYTSFIQYFFFPTIISYLPSCYFSYLYSFYYGKDGRTGWMVEYFFLFCFYPKPTCIAIYDKIFFLRLLLRELFFNLFCDHGIGNLPSPTIIILFPFFYSSNNFVSLFSRILIHHQIVDNFLRLF